MERIEDTAQIVADKIIKRKPFYKHSSIVICGENSFGKSTLIRHIVRKCMNLSENVYYIDSQNRQICDYDSFAGGIPLEKMSIDSIVENRLAESNYLKKDVFAGMSSGPAVTYSRIKKYPEKYNDLYWDFFGITIKDEKDNPGEVQRPRILVNDRTEIYDVSSSQAAKMRMLLEIDFAIEEKGATIIVIDEFDLCLSDNTASTFLAKLHEKYKKVIFIVSVQSLSLILQIEDFDIAIIRGNGDMSVDNNVVHFVDSNSVTEVGQIDKIRELIGKVGEKCNLEEMVARVVDTETISDNDLNYIENIERNKLSGREKILYDYLVRLVKV